MHLKRKVHVDPTPKNGLHLTKGWGHAMVNGALRTAFDSTPNGKVKLVGGSSTQGGTGEWVVRGHRRGAGGRRIPWASAQKRRRAELDRIFDRPVPINAPHPHYHKRKRKGERMRERVG